MARMGCEWVANRQLSVDDLPVLHVFRMKCPAARQQSCRDDERSVDRQALTLGSLQRPFMGLDGDRLDHADGADLRRDFADFGSRHAQFARSHHHELVQNLDADRAPNGEQFFCPIGLGCVCRQPIEHDTAAAGTGALSRDRRGSVGPPALAGAVPIHSSLSPRQVARFSSGSARSPAPAMSRSWCCRCRVAPPCSSPRPTPCRRPSAPIRGRDPRRNSCSRRSLARQ